MKTDFSNVSASARIEAQFGKKNTVVTYSTFSMSPKEIKDSFKRGSDISSPVTYSNPEKQKSESLFRKTKAEISSFKNSRMQRIEAVSFGADDYAEVAELTPERLKKTFSAFNKFIGESLLKKNIPADIEFEFDYDCNNRSVTVTKISDEKYLDDVTEIMARPASNAPLSAANASKIMNGGGNSVYYPFYKASLQNSFGQDIERLFINDDGSLGGVNSALREALEKEKTDPRFNAPIEYNFYSKEILEPVKRLVADKDSSECISHMKYKNGRVTTDDGDIKLGENFLDNIDKNDTDLVIRTAAAGMWLASCFWLKFPDAFGV